jgi:uncharacterized protein YukE
MDIHMDVPAVHTVADNVATIPGPRENVAKALQPSTDAAKANPAWRSSPPLAACTDAWRQHLTDLIQQTADTAKKLHDSADHVQEVDQRTAQVFKDFMPN